MSTPALPYYQTLSAEHRLRLFSTMRKLGAELDALYAIERRLIAPHGHLEVGGGRFEYTLKATIVDSYLRALRKGNTPQEAKTYTETERTACVKVWNTHRGRDYVVHRLLDAEQLLIERIHKQIIDSVV